MAEAGADGPLEGQLLLTLWSACSSLAHGDMSGTFGLLRYEIVSLDEQSAVVRLTGNCSMLRKNTTQAGIGLIDQALALYQRRAASPWPAN
ncbi:hypothetical protein [Streptomyces virginiae]|uniref:hypothetical protein n=1 Tax=Streptomyces virginiae TaxID=1961 RepID=UPI00344363C8